MSMTPEELYQLSSFGQIPAETDISALVDRFWDGSCGVFNPERTLQQSMIVIENKTTDISPLQSRSFDVSAKFSPFIHDSHSWAGVLLILHLQDDGSSYSVNCKYMNGNDASYTTKAITSGIYAHKCPLVYGWLVSASNFSQNTKFYLYTSSGTVRAKWSILGFPYREVVQQS